MNHVKKITIVVTMVVVIGFCSAMGGFVAYDWLWGVDYHLRAGKESLKRRSYVQAEAHVALALESRPNSPEAHLLAAQIARRAVLPVLPGATEGLGHSLTVSSRNRVGSYEKAQEHLSAYKKLGGIPEMFDLEQRLIRVQSGALGQEEADLHFLIAGDSPESLVILEALIKGYLRAYRLPEAGVCLNQWLERTPDIQALLWRGWVFERLNNKTNAQKDYLRVLELDANSAEAHRRLGEMLISSKPEKAVQHFTILQQQQPADPDVLLNLARCRRSLGQQEESRLLIDQLLANNPRNSSALIERGLLALSEDQTVQAEVWFRQALALEPYDRVANYQLLLCLERLGKKAEAQRVKTKLDNIAKDLQLLYEVTAKVMSEPNRPQWRYEAGGILLRNGQKEEGRRWLLSALESDPRHGPTHAALAAFYESEGNRDLALRHRQLASRGGDFPH
jgi:tetratricopeptide (TPR) repeat protein